MVNPAGYTALDLIGFTDKGPYSSSANYVKNDLVHYSGNIWRCLIDDTSGIAPVEGVNWTLFIGEPTNLVERIIAPVETDPATSAWAVGRQIIFNDNLYEVIAAITAGDALVTYEDDPTNANIKLADPVETQLLNVKGNLSNRNLLDNAWFTVNQRGQSSYVTTANSQYTLDRWFCYYSDTQVTINSDGSITLGEGPSSSRNEYLRQYLELDLSKKLHGKTITISAIDENGKLWQATGTVPTTVPSSNITVVVVRVKDTSNVEIGQVACTLRSNGVLHSDIISVTGHTITIKAVKLELGSISTLAMDTAPNYAEELLKCQRYFYRYKANDSSGYMGMGGIQSTNNLRFILNLPTTMRQSPTITYSGSFNIADFGASNISTNITNITKQAFHGNSIVMIVQSSDTLVAATPAILKANSDANAYIDFSADF